MKQIMKWGILGLDLIANEFAQMLMKKQGVYAICTADKERASKFQKEYCVTCCYTDEDTFINDQAINVVYVSTYGNFHFHQIMKCLKKGKHVFCEKAMFTNSEEAKVAFAYASNHNLFLGEANTLFYMPLYKEINKMIKNDAIGNLKMIRAEFGSLKKEDQELAVYRTDRAGGALLDIGIYALTASLLYMGTEVKQIQSICSMHPYGVDERCSIMLKSNREVLSSIDISLRSKLPKRLIIAGDKGYFEIYNYPRADSAELVFPDMRRKKIMVGDSSKAVMYEIEQVENSIQENNFDYESLGITQTAMEIMDYIKSEKEGKIYG